MRFDIHASCNGNVKYLIPHKRTKKSTLANQFWSFLIYQVKKGLLSAQDLMKQALASFSGDSGVSAGSADAGGGGSECRNSYSGTDPPASILKLAVISMMATTRGFVLKYALPVVMLFAGSVLTGCNGEEPRSAEMRTARIQMQSADLVERHIPQSTFLERKQAIRDTNAKTDVYMIKIRLREGGFPTRSPPTTAQLIEYIAEMFSISPTTMRGEGDAIFASLTEQDSVFLANLGFDVKLSGGIYRPSNTIHYTDALNQMNQKRK